MKLIKLGRLVVISALALGCFAGEMSSASAQSGEVIIRVAPPAPRVEARGSIRAGYEWVPGYWRWEGRRHAWVSGHWERARAGYVWQPARWQRRYDGWVFVPGRWVRRGQNNPPPAYDPPRHEEPRHDQPPYDDRPSSDRPYDGRGRRHGYGRGYWQRQGWQFLGEAWVQGRRDRDHIEIGGKSGGKYHRLLLVAEDSDIEMHDILITFANGRTWSPEVRHYFRENQRSRAIYLPNAPRFLRSIDFAYGNLPGGGRARIQVWAK